jgi:hypothetical protein
MNYKAIAGAAVRAPSAFWTGKDARRDQRMAISPAQVKIRRSLPFSATTLGCHEHRIKNVKKQLPLL